MFLKIRDNKHLAKCRTAAHPSNGLLAHSDLPPSASFIFPFKHIQFASLRNLAWQRACRLHERNTATIMPPPASDRRDASGAIGVLTSLCCSTVRDDCCSECETPRLRTTHAKRKTESKGQTANLNGASGNYDGGLRWHAETAASDSRSCARVSDRAEPEPACRRHARVLSRRPLHRLGTAS